MSRRVANSNSGGERLIALLLVGMVIFLVWSWLATFYPDYILPSPVAVARRARELFRQGGLFAVHFRTTLGEAFLGFLLGAGAALPLSYLLARHPRLDRLVTPVVVAIQAIPIVALAPLMVIWFGFGLTSKVIIAALTAFFPVLTNGVVGLRETDPRLKEMFKIMGAGKREIFFKLEVPSALPVLFGGFRMGLTLSVIGAVVGEFSGAGRGLGYLVYFARGTFDTALIFVALLALAVMGIGFYLLVSWLEAVVMPWRKDMDR
ncbi:MAG TPA: ABC transporter permease [Firmicutes bacterium]|uniref:ABC transporter permease n=1 Tax=Capillibacterium thermochitinicola TaxID=2699427 RepID=A0A8J6I2P5_9FIRM|nr:ABC transporter permease [Capillibacterium thermochitinicola]MBA2133162.1 ABC transporter permease [Capillibacterium thermochitinicola]HHW11705.1 ABC transporter permease [Bacillota bacterium]